MANQALRQTLSLETENVDDDEYHDAPFSQCKTCQSDSRFPTSPRHISEHGMWTRNTTTSAARGAVFNTLELFENILLQLPENDLLTARRVTVHWNAVIMTSPRLRRKLFLQGEDVRVSWTVQMTEADEVKVTGEELQGEIIYLTLPAKLNPMLFKTAPTHLRKSLIERVQAAEYIHLLASPNLVRKNIVHHSMLLSQPPATQVTIDFQYRLSNKRNKAADGAARRPFRQDRHPHRTLHLVRDVRNPAGVTFGEVLKAFRHGVKATMSSSMDCSIRGGYLSSLRMSGVVFATEWEREMVRNGEL